MNVVDKHLTFAYNPGLRHSTNDIILHHAAGDGSVEDVHAYHRDVNQWAGIAYHFYVGKDGIAYRGRDIEWNGGHTQGRNYDSIGVCFEGNFEKEEMNEAQLAAGKELMRYLHQLYPNAGIIGHRDANSTACPGKNFPADAIISYAYAPDEEEASPWAKEAVQKWIDMGVLQGNGESCGFKEPITLERMIVLVERRLEA